MWGGKEGVSVSKLDSDEFAELGQASGAGAAGVGSGPQQADSALQRAESGSLARSSRQSSLGCGAATCLPWCAQASSAEEVRPESLPGPPGTRGCCCAGHVRCGVVGGACPTPASTRNTNAFRQ